MNNYFLVGIKGSGMSSLALILKKMGHYVFGVDKDTYFKTQEKLINNNINIYNDFSLTNISEKIDIVIYSSAYENNDFIHFLKNNYTCYSYIEYISYLSRNKKTYAIAGTHGKTTTSAATTFALSYKKRKDFPFFSIFGSSLIGENDCTFQGDKAFIIEACEYREHFLEYNVDGAIVTSIDFDHPDYFKSEKDVINSFFKFATKINKNGFLILNIDDKNIKGMISSIKKMRNDLNIITYGFYDKSIFRIQKDNLSDGYKVGLTHDELYTIKYFNKALVSDMLGAAILSTCILLDQQPLNLYLENDDLIVDEIFTTIFRLSLKSLEAFNGVVGRLDYKAEFNNIIFLDDYAHHPKEIYTLINEIRHRYPNRKIFACFSFHTASRTKALYKEFLAVLLLFDKLVITKTFMSARMDVDNENLDKKMVNDLNKKLLSSYKIKLSSVLYAREEEVSSICASMLEDNDIFLSLGASNNDDIYKDIIKELRKG